MVSEQSSVIEPPPDCPRCPRLAALRDQCKIDEPSWYCRPAKAFGGLDARLLVVGLAPGLRGANRTGRVFTGDASGKTLYAAMGRAGFAQGAYGGHARDGLKLVAARVTNAVRCVPPKNKPTAAEQAQCRDFLVAEIAALPRLAAILCLGRLAHDNVLRAVAARRSVAPFSHGARHTLEIAGAEVALFDSYHCSRYNMNTRVLTPEMLDAVFDAIRKELDGPQAFGFEPR